MKTIRVTSNWERALVYYLRVKVCVEGLNISAESEFDEYDVDKTDYILLMDGKEAVATGRFRVIDGKAKFERICVAFEYQKKGIGKILVEELEKWSKEKGINEVIISGKEEVKEFYTKLGYTTDSKVSYLGNTPIVWLHKNLNDSKLL